MPTIAGEATTPIINGQPPERSRSMPNILSRLVGDHFRPPASVILSHLSLGTPLHLLPEPENPYDPNAVGVWWDASAVPDSLTDEVLLPSGWSRERLANLVDSCFSDDAFPWLQLGYLAATEKTADGYKTNTAALLVLAGTNGEYSAELSFSPSGKALVKISWPTEASDINTTLAQTMGASPFHNNQPDPSQQ